MRTLIGFRGLFLTGAIAIAMGLGALLSTIIYLQGSTHIFSQRADMAQKQVLLLARIDAEAAQILLNHSSAAQNELSNAVRAYFESISAETALIGGTEPELRYQAEEEANARYLVSLLRSGSPALPDIRAMVRHIAAKENREAEVATQAARQAQSDAWRLILAISIVLLALPFGGAVFLWRHLVKPLEAVAHATQSIAREGDDHHRADVK